MDDQEIEVKFSDWLRGYDSDRDGTPESGARYLLRFARDLLASRPCGELVSMEAIAAKLKSISQEASEQGYPFQGSWFDWYAERLFNLQLPVAEVQSSNDQASFEAWMRDNRESPKLEKSEEGGYLNFGTIANWELWQGARSHLLTHTRPDMGAVVEKCYRCKTEVATAHFYGQKNSPVCASCYRALDDEFDRTMDGGS